MKHKENAKHTILSLIKKSKNQDLKTIVLEDRIDNVIEEIVQETRKRVIAEINRNKK